MMFLLLWIFLIIADFKFFNQECSRRRASSRTWVAYSLGVIAAVFVLSYLVLFTIFMLFRFEPETVHVLSLLFPFLSMSIAIATLYWLYGQLKEAHPVAVEKEKRVDL